MITVFARRAALSQVWLHAVYGPIGKYLNVGITQILPKPSLHFFTLVPT